MKTGRHLRREGGPSSEKGLPLRKDPRTIGLLVMTDLRRADVPHGVAQTALARRLRHRTSADEKVELSKK